MNPRSVRLLASLTSRTGGIFIPQKLGDYAVAGCAIGPNSEADAIFIADGQQFTAENPLMVSVIQPYEGHLDPGAYFWPAKTYLNGTRMELLIFTEAGQALAFRARARQTVLSNVGASTQIAANVCGRNKIRIWLSNATLKDFVLSISTFACGPSSLVAGGAKSLTQITDSNAGYNVLVAGGQQSYELPLWPKGPSGGFDTLVLTTPALNVDGTAIGNGDITALISAED